VQKDLSKESKILSKHYVKEIDGTFFSQDKKEKLGFGIVTSKQLYNIKLNTKDEETLTTIPLGKGIYLSKEILLVEKKDLNFINNDPFLNNKMPNSVINNSEERLNNVVNLTKNNDNVGIFYTRDLKSNLVKKNKWKKDILKDDYNKDKIAYIELNENKMDKINKIMD
jgi:hypothetical protein